LRFNPKITVIIEISQSPSNLEDSDIWDRRIYRMMALMTIRPT